MANSIITAVGDGTTTQYALNFTLGILRRSYVTCRVGSEVDGSGNPLYRSLEWITDGLVNIQGDAPALGQPIVFTRTMPKTQLIHDYTNGVPIIEDNLDESNLQSLMSIQEFLDGRLDAGFVQNLNMNNFKVTNVATATNDGDAVNFGQMTNAIGDAPTFAAQAEASADAAALSESNTAFLESSAASILAQVQAIYDDFDDRYLGEYAVEPLVDNDGDALDIGAIFFNTTDTYLMVYSGSMWLALDLTIADNSITQAKLASNSVGTGELIDESVTILKLDPSVASTFDLPAGAVIPFAMNVAPSGWLPCDGSAVSRSVYSDVFSAIGTVYGTGDGSTTFNLPDLRGEFIRGLDNGRGVDSGRVLGSLQLDDFASHKHIGGSGYIGSFTSRYGNVATGTNSQLGSLTQGANATGAYTSTEGGNETRPRNIAMMYCIKI